jgi:hypothetical protein
MHVYIAYKSRKECVTGGWRHCLSWARRESENNDVAIKILKARGDEKEARVVAEVADDHLRPISNGRLIKIRNLQLGQAHG